MTSYAVKVAPIGKVAVGVRSGITGRDGINGTGAVNSVNGKAGDVVLVWTDIDGTIPTSKIPAAALTIPTVVADEAAMLALDAQQGDVAIRSDNQVAYMLCADGDPTVLADWLAISTPGGVTSVNSQTGIVVLAAGDVGAVPTARKINGYDLTADRTLAASDVGAAPASPAVYDNGSKTGTFTLAIANGPAQEVSLSGNSTISVSTAAASGVLSEMRLFLTANGKTVTWDSAIAWVGGTAPTLPATGVVELVFTTVDGGGSFLAHPRSSGGGTPPPPDVQNFTTSGTWTKPAGARFVLFEGIGGGAAGAYNVSTPRGGGGGAYTPYLFDADSLDATEAVTVGTGGSSSGAVGGNTSFGGATAGGGSNSLAFTSTVVSGNDGGVAPSGSYSVAATAAQRYSGGYGGVQGGAGGSSLYGAGGGGCNNGAAGSGGTSGDTSRLLGGNGGTKSGSATAPGGGGAGWSSSPGFNNGAAGAARITTYF